MCMYVRAHEYAHSLSPDLSSMEVGWIIMATSVAGSCAGLMLLASF